MIPHARRLGLRFLDKQGAYVVTQMPYNPELDVLPGSGIMANGAITTFLDTALGSAVYDKFETYKKIATLDLRVDYFEKPTAFSSVVAKTRCLKVTDQVVFVQGDAYCTDETKPIAHAVAVFSYQEITSLANGPEGQIL